MVICVDRSTPVKIWIFEPYIKASLKRFFRSYSFLIAERKIVVNSTMKIINEFRYRRPFIRN